MYQLMKAEFDNNKILLSILYAVVIVVILAYMLWGWENIDESLPAVRAVMLSAAAMLFLTRLLKLQREKKDRFHILLPLPVRSVAISRMLFPVLFWLSMLFLLCLGLVLLRTASIRAEIVFDWLTLTGFIIAGNVVPLIHRDLNYYSAGKHQKRLMFIFYSIMILTGYTLFMLFVMTFKRYSFSQKLIPVQERFLSLSGSFLGATAFMAIGIGLATASIFLFQHRKSYID